MFETTPTPKPNLPQSHESVLLVSIIFNSGEGIFLSFQKAGQLDLKMWDFNYNGLSTLALFRF